VTEALALMELPLFALVCLSTACPRGYYVILPRSSRIPFPTHTLSSPISVSSLLGDK
jgi:hypothetical protein